MPTETNYKTNLPLSTKIRLQIIDSLCYLLTNHSYQLSVSYVSQKCFHSYATYKYASWNYQSFV